MSDQHAETVCTHSWRTCPVHGTGTDELPPFRTVVTCLYRGLATKDGGTWDEDTTNEVVDRIVRRIDG